MRRLIYLIPLAIITILVLQSTKDALLPRQQTPLLWGAAIVTLIGVVLLESGLAGRHWKDAQASLGTVANNFYEPRRTALINGFAIAGGVFGGLWWGAATWGVVMTGMRRGVTGRGLFDFEISVLVGALTGGVIGAVTGLVIGHFWEMRHRRHRA